MITALESKKEIKVGGSEVAAIMGLSRWESPLKLWAEKTGRIQPEDISGFEWVELGTELEDFVAKKFAKKTGLKVRRTSQEYVYEKYPYMTGHIDRLIEGTNDLLECKTANAWKVKEWLGEEIPQEYILQVMWYLGITGRRKGYIACLIGGQKFVWKEILFDPSLFENQVEAVRNFVEHNVKEDVAPVAISGDSETLNLLYPQQSAPSIETEDPEIITIVSEIQALKRIVANAESEQEAKEAVLKQKMGEAEGLITPEFKVTWKQQNTSKLNYYAMKEDGTYEKYLVKGTTRVLRINAKKEK